MTLKEARKILGKLAVGCTDEQIAEDLRTAVLLKDLFFDILISDKKTVANANE